MRSSIRTTILAAFAVDVVLMLALGIFALSQMAEMNRQATLVEVQTVPSLRTVDKIGGVLTHYRSLQLEYIINTNVADKDRLEREMFQLEATMADYFHTYDQLLAPGSDHRTFDQLKAAWDVFIQANHKRFLPASRLNNTGTVHPVFSRLTPLYNDVVDTANRLADENQRQATDSLRDVQAAYQRARYVIGADTLITLVLSALIGLVLSARIARRVRKLTDATIAVAGGDFERSVPAQGADEIAVLARNFNQMVTSLRLQRQALEQQKNDIEASLHVQRQLTDDLVRGKAAEEAAYRAKAAAEAANQAKSVFLATMSHELRTPLTAILGYAQLLHLTARQQQAATLFEIERIQAAGKHLLTIISNILDFSKIEQGKMRVDAQVFDLYALADNVISIIAPIAAERQNQLKLEIRNEIEMMYSDPGKIQQILFNFLSNAVKFTESGVVTLKITREDRMHGDWVRFDIIDTGIGIKAEHIPLLFQPFTQVDASENRKYDGTGLGLAVSRQLCELLGGDVSVESVYGAGSTFTFRIPGLLPREAAVYAPRDAVYVTRQSFLSEQIQ